MAHSRFGTLAIAVVIATAMSACGDTTPTPSSGSRPQIEPSFPPQISPYEPKINAEDFVGGIDNPYMPLAPGTHLVYEGFSEGEKETIDIFVKNETRTIMGVECTVVRDVVTMDGEIVERTFDWFAQDRFGNVWYFGEDSWEYKNGKPVSAHGSWEGGVNGALPGIVMLGDPQVGDKYRQEYFVGEAEDMGQVLKLDGSVTVPYGSYDEVLVTKDFSPIDPQLLEHKYYAKGIGFVFEESLKGPSGAVRLVGVTND